MALPKRRQSKTRGRKRRTNWKLDAPGMTMCDNCGEKKLPHHICPHCGYYNGREIINPAAE